MANSAEKNLSKRLGRVSTGLLTTALAFGGLAATIGPAGAAPGTPGQTVKDYANYPDNQSVPAGCSGDDALVGVKFSNGGRTVLLRDPDPTKPSGLSGLTPLEPGTVTMTWDSFKPGCEGIVVSLASYRLTGFEPHAKNSAVTEEIQRVNDGWEYRAAGSTGPFSLSVDVPDDPNECYHQLDAVIGLPLEQIGPGAFFSNHKRIDENTNMLISAWNNTPTDDVCAPSPPSSTTTTTAPPAVEDTTTTTAAPTPAPEVEQTAPAPTPTPEPQVAAATATQPQTQVLGIAATRAATLPVTGAGSATPWLAGMSALLLAAGAALAGQGRRLARRSA